MPMDQTFKYIFKNEMPWNSCSINWTISDIEKIGASASSPKFSAGLDEQWELNLSISSNQLQCYLKLCTSQMTMNAIAEIAVLINGKKHLKVVSPHLAFCGSQTNHAVWFCEKKRVVEFLEQHGLKRDNDFELPFVCELTVWRPDLVKVSSFTEQNVEVKHNLTANLTKQWKNKSLTDVTLEADGKIFKGHKIILASMSPVFEAMFREGTKEQEDSHVIINDIDSDVFEVFLHYLYSGEAVQLDEMVADLLAAADKYSVESLREICIRHMSKNISGDNAAEIFMLADRHSIEHVKELALDFIKSHTFDVAMSEKWEMFRKSYPHLVKVVPKKE